MGVEPILMCAPGCISHPHDIPMGGLRKRSYAVFRFLCALNRNPTRGVYELQKYDIIFDSSHASMV